MNRTELCLGTGENGTPARLLLEDLYTHALLLASSGRGKTRLLVQLFTELATRTNDGVVGFFADSQAYRLARAAMFERGLDPYLVPIDPREQRRVCGVNPLRAWGTDLETQASCSADVVLRALGNPDFNSTPMLGQWMSNLMYALLSTGLTMAEAPRMLDFNDGRFRRAVVERMPDSQAKSEWLFIERLTQRSTPVQLLRTLMELLGSTQRRIGHYTRNPYLRSMLSTREHVIDWGTCINRGLLVPINVSQEANALTLEHQRLWVAQSLASLLRETLARPESQWRRVWILLDEAWKFVTPEISEILAEGRKYGPKIILATQSLSQFVDPRTGDTTMRDLVLGVGVKIVFGGLPPADADLMARACFGHLGDPDKRKLELMTPVQLSHVEEVESTTRGRSLGASELNARGRSRARGRSSMSGSSNGVGSGHGSSSGFSSSLSGLDHQGMFSQGASHSDQWFGGDFEGEAESEAEAESEVHAEGRSRTRNASVSRGKMVVPDEPEERLSSVQFESVADQLHREQSAMVRLPKQHAFLVVGQNKPVPFQVADVPDAQLTEDQLHFLDYRIIRRLPCYATPETIAAEVERRHRDLLTPPRIELVDAATALARRRAARSVRASGLGDQGREDGDSAAGLIAVGRPVRPRSGRGGAAAKIVREA